MKLEDLTKAELVNLVRRFAMLSEAEEYACLAVRRQTLMEQWERCIGATDAARVLVDQAMDAWKQVEATGTAEERFFAFREYMSRRVKQDEAQQALALAYDKIIRSTEPS